MTTAEAPPTTIDAVALRRYLDGPHRVVREHVRGVLAHPDLARDPAPASTAEHRRRVSEQARALARTGGTALGFPSEFGGLDRVGASIAAFETLGHGDLSLLVKCGVQFGLSGGAVLHLGTRRHHERHLAALASLELPGCFAMSETGHGSNVHRLRTTATYDPERGEFVVETPDDDARKDYIGNAAEDARLAAVFAQLVVAGESHGVHALLVPIRDDDGRVLPGVRVSDCGEKAGLAGVDNGRIWFEGVRVPREALLDRYARVGEDGSYSSPIANPDRRFFTMLGTLIQGRISVGGAAISAAKSALAIAVRHALRRRQFGPPGSDEEVLLLDYRIHQRRLLPALARTYALHFAQQRLVADLERVFGDSGGSRKPDDDRARRELETRAAGLKAVATWHATETIQACRECCGGAGYLRENRFAELREDTDVFTTFEGDNTILLQLVAKSLLTGFRDELGELGPVATAGFIAGQALETAVERSAAREIIQRLTDDLVPSREREGDLRDRGYHLGLFRWRAQHMLTGVARRLKRGIESGREPFEVFNECQDHVVATARAHVATEVLEELAAAVERCEDPALTVTLDRICDLYALVEIEAERGWFQEHGRVSSTRAKLVTRAVNRLCGELRAGAYDLVDAFGIPDAVLAAPIGLPGGEASRTAAAEVGVELPDARVLASQIG